MRETATTQNTLKKDFTLSGKGLHTGLQSSVTFRPAPENHGYKIRRIDLPNQPIIDARADNVHTTNRGTLLSVDGVQVGTIEHGLAALYANGIDNCLIDVDAPEFPILDGSSIEYVKKIIEVGICKQKTLRKYFIPKQKIEYKDEATGAHLILLPADDFSIHTQIAFDSQVLEVQSAKLDSLAEFNSKFAPCRTFVFVREIEMLMQGGLIKGGDLDNAIVIYDRPIEQNQFDKLAEIMKVKKRNAHDLGYIMSEPLRFPNEPARHKLLDVIGDLSLTGKFIKGTIISVCPGHKANNMFARLILDDMKNEVALPSFVKENIA